MMHSITSTTVCLRKTKILVVVLVRENKDVLSKKKKNITKIGMELRKKAFAPVQSPNQVFMISDVYIRK